MATPGKRNLSWSNPCVMQGKPPVWYPLGARADNLCAGRRLPKARGIGFLRRVQIRTLEDRATLQVCGQGEDGPVVRVVKGDRTPLLQHPALAAFWSVEMKEFGEAQDRIHLDSRSAELVLVGESVRPRLLRSAPPHDLRVPGVLARVAPLGLDSRLGPRVRPGSPPSSSEHR